MRIFSSRDIIVILCRIIPVMVVSTSAGYARILEERTRPCEGGGREIWTLFEDDCHGGEFTLLVDCEGRHHVEAPRPGWAMAGAPVFGEEVKGQKAKIKN